VYIYYLFSPYLDFKKMSDNIVIFFKNKISKYKSLIHQVVTKKIFSLIIYNKLHNIWFEHRPKKGFNFCNILFKIIVIYLFKSKLCIKVNNKLTSSVVFKLIGNHFKLFIIIKLGLKL